MNHSLAIKKQMENKFISRTYTHTKWENSGLRIVSIVLVIALYSSLSYILQISLALTIISHIVPLDFNIGESNPTLSLSSSTFPSHFYRHLGSILCIASQYDLMFCVFLVQMNYSP